jgi:DNA-directed RNA polymerase subunit RPC12/RpoP
MLRGNWGGGRRVGGDPRVVSARQHLRNTSNITEDSENLTRLNDQAALAGAAHDHLELADMARPQSLIATVEIYVCSICDKPFGSDYSSCARHISCGRYNRCRELGATAKRLTNIVSRHDRNVGGRQAHLQPEPASAAPVQAHTPH